MKKVLWQELRRTEFEQAVRDKAVVVIPVASIEQHGNHLPVNTDSFDCFAIAKQAAETINDFTVLVLPVIWTGFSPHHMPYPGTVSLKMDTFIDLLTEVTLCVHGHGFRKILILNGHGGNSNIISALRTKLSYENKISRIVTFTWWELPGMDNELAAISEADHGDIGHAGEIETSLQMYLQPELVDSDQVSWDKGVIGDPTKATQEKGKLLFEAAVKALISYLNHMHNVSSERVGISYDKDIPANWRQVQRM